MASESLFAEACTDLPQSDGPVPGTRKEIVRALNKLYIRNIVFMPVECLTALVVVIAVP